jgi:hypothetical protein
MIFQNEEGCYEVSRIIPMTGMTEEMTVFFIGILLPLIVSILTAILFARLFAPLFLKAKHAVIASSYKDGYITRKSKATQKGVIIKRMIFTILLTFGFLAALIPNLNITDWITEEDICSYGEHGANTAYNFTMLITVFGILFPISIGLSSVSWAIEDSGLMHYSFKTEDYFEIEPVHTKYSSYLNGYAGISAIIFVVEFVTIVATTNSYADATLIFAVLVIAIGCFLPAYFIFVKTMKDHAYLREDLKEMKILTENDIQ